MSEGFDLVNPYNLLKSLTDQELSEVIAAASVLRHERMEERYANGGYPPLNEKETALVSELKIIEAVRTYRERTGTLLLEAKFVIDRSRDWSRYD